MIYTCLHLLFAQRILSCMPPSVNIARKPNKSGTCIKYNTKNAVNKNDNKKVPTTIFFKEKCDWIFRLFFNVARYSTSFNPKYYYLN